ncbi:Protein RMD5 A [Rhynchospora pubera]|uniref:Protein RMD5 A n=1 Tax=Rhynchospora pubera TaxID=906938 RepID=A0AAV8G8L1_9POAL|nr:Protein RMD5 A [Rhynchospora pubera]
MDVDTIRESFDRVEEKQKQYASRSQEIIDQLIKEIELAITKLQDGNLDQSAILAQLKAQIDEITPVAQFEGCQKELNLAIAKYTKLLEKTFHSDISKAYRDVEMDTATINEIIASHFYRQGQFEIGDGFSSEAQVSESVILKSPFLEMHSILQAMRQSRDLGPALAWVTKNRDKLLRYGSSLELKLHELQFIEMLKAGKKGEALKYARAHLSPWANEHQAEIQKVFACLLWENRLDQSPYGDLSSPSQWKELESELVRQFCGLMGQSHESPLAVTVAAGAEGLPTLLKLASVMQAKKQEWQEMKQLPVPLDLPKEYQFHSVFVCPVLREQGSEENPPMLMPCGHVLSRQSILKLSKNSTRAFKCPYCPQEGTVAQCRQLYF